MRLKNLTFCLFILSIVALCRSFALPNTEGIQVYQKNIHLFPERKQTLAEDISRYRNADDLWDVLRQEFTLPHYEETPGVQAQINWFLSHQEFLLNTTNRAAPYMYFILQQARKRHLPIELVLLPMIESAYNPFAYSTAGAAGIWQMMPDTASGYGIKQDWWYDGRRDIVISTQAALNHLSYLGNFFEGNWLLAIAAYDTGEGNVLAAINKNIREGRNIDFWSLPLAQETRDYVPRLLALAAIIEHPERYPVYLPPIHDAPCLAQVDVGTRIDLKYAAGLAGLSFKKLLQLNPAYNHTETDPNGPSKIILPIENVMQFTENLAVIDPEKAQLPVATPTQEIDNFSVSPTMKKVSNALATTFEKVNGGKYHLQPGDTIYMARNGDNLEKIASHFHVAMKVLQMINQRPPGNAVSPGERFIIPTHLSQTQFADASTQQNYELAPGDTIYVVRPGDTIDTIAKKFNTTPPAIRLANFLADNDLRNGENLIIPAHL
jgi:membrane-bound lytic murein transglycosylase D